MLKLQDNETITLPVTLNGETRQIEFKLWQRDEYEIVGESDYLFTARCGRTGQKHHAATLRCFKLLKSRRDGSPVVNPVWQIDFTYYNLNRNTGRVHSFADRCRWNTDGNRWEERFGKVAQA